MDLGTPRRAHTGMCICPCTDTFVRDAACSVERSARVAADQMHPRGLGRGSVGMDPDRPLLLGVARRGSRCGRTPSTVKRTTRIRQQIKSCVIQVPKREFVRQGRIVVSTAKIIAPTPFTIFNLQNVFLGQVDCFIFLLHYEPFLYMCKLRRAHNGRQKQHVFGLFFVLKNFTKNITF